MSESLGGQSADSIEERIVVLGKSGYEAHVYKEGKLLYIDSFDHEKDLPPEVGKIFPAPESSLNFLTPSDRIKHEKESAQRSVSAQKLRESWSAENNSQKKSTNNLYSLELIKSD